MKPLGIPAERCDVAEVILEEMHDAAVEWSRDGSDIVFKTHLLASLREWCSSIETEFDIVSVADFRFLREQLTSNVQFPITKHHFYADASALKRLAADDEERDDRREKQSRGEFSRKDFYYFYSKLKSFLLENKAASAAESHFNLLTNVELANPYVEKTIHIVANALVYYCNFLRPREYFSASIRSEEREATLTHFPMHDEVINRIAIALADVANAWSLDPKPILEAWTKGAKVVVATSEKIFLPISHEALRRIKIAELPVHLRKIVELTPKCLETNQIDGSTIALAKERLRRANDAFMQGTAAVVHFSTGIMGKSDCGAVPVNHIAAYYRVNGNPHCKFFDSRKPHQAVTCEMEALKECLDFFESHQQMAIVVWRNEPSWGFEHVVRRLSTMSSEEARTPPALQRFIDLNQHLQDIYGHDYSSHDRLKNCIRMNAIEVANLLTSEEAAIAFSTNNFEKLRMYTTARCKAIATILEKAATNTLITNPRHVESREPPAMPPAKRCAVTLEDGQIAIVRGNKKHLGSAEFKVISALVSSWPTRQTGTKLTKTSGKESPNKPLRSLAKKDKDWEKVILFPTKDGPGAGYGLESE